MSVTTTIAPTLKTVLDKANPNDLADALKLVALGTLLTPIVSDSGTLASPSATITLDPPALFVQSVQVPDGDSDTGEGSYLAADANAVTSVAAALNGPGVCALSADGTTLTFASAYVNQAIVQYIPLPATDLDSAFARS